MIVVKLVWFFGSTSEFALLCLGSNSFLVISACITYCLRMFSEFFFRILGSVPFSTYRVYLPKDFQLLSVMLESFHVTTQNLKTKQHSSSCPKNFQNQLPPKQLTTVNKMHKKKCWTLCTFTKKDSLNPEPLSHHLCRIPSLEVLTGTGPW